MIVTLLTDFGASDAYVASMKGVILTHEASIRIVDISHLVPPQSIETAAYLLLTCYRDFPSGTVHTVVVDPGVGSSRLPIVAEAAGQLFVAPDNGVLAGVLERDGGSVREISNPDLRRPEVSHTFHGRDIFSFAAAHLATGFPVEEVGAVVERPVRGRALSPLRSANGYSGQVIHIDHFGNCVINIQRGDLEHAGGRLDGTLLKVGGQTIRRSRTHFAAAEGESPFMYWGSAGFLEVGVNMGSAADHLEVNVGAPVSLQMID